jgi:hypothetical protein
MLVGALIACASISAGSLVAAAAQQATPPPGSQTTAPPPGAPQTTAPTRPDYNFPSGAGMFFFYVKPEKAADFEAIVAKIVDVLAKTQDPVLKQQATGWKIYKSLETPKDGAVYVFFFDPAITGADYDPVRVLGDALPTEVQALYERLKDVLVKVEKMGLTKIR